MKNIKKPSKAKESAALLEALTNFPGAFRVWMLRELHDLGCAPRSTLTAQHKVARSELNISLDYIDDTGVYFLVSYKSGQVNIPRHGGVSLLSLISIMRAMGGYSIERDMVYKYFDVESVDVYSAVAFLFQKHRSISRLNSFQCVSSYNMDDIVEFLMSKGNMTKEFLVVQAGIRAANQVEASRVASLDKSTLDPYDYVLRQLLDGELDATNVATSTALAVKSLRSGIQWYELFDEKIDYV